MNAALEVAAAFVKRDWQDAVSYRFPFALDLLTAGFTLTLFFFLGELFDGAGATSNELSGGYFTFALIGIAVFGLGSAALSSPATRLRGEQVEGTLEALMSTRAPSWLLVVSSGAYDVLYAGVRALLLIGVGTALFDAEIDTTPAGLAAAVVATVCSVLVLAAVGVVAAAFTVVFKQATTITGILGTGLSLLCGVYFPVDELPRGLQLIGEALPPTWALDVARAGLTRGEVDTVHLALLLPTAAIAVPVAMPVFQHALRRAKRDGSLAEY